MGGKTTKDPPLSPERRRELIDELLKQVDRELERERLRVRSQERELHRVLGGAMVIQKLLDVGAFREEFDEPLREWAARPFLPVLEIDGTRIMPPTLDV